MTAHVTYGCKMVVHKLCAFFLELPVAYILLISTTLSYVSIIVSLWLCLCVCLCVRVNRNIIELLLTYLLVRERKL